MKLEQTFYLPAVLFGPRDAHDVRKLAGELHVKTKDNYYVPVRLLAGAARLFEGADCFDKHPEYGLPAIEKRQRIGRVQEATWHPDKHELRGVLAVKSPPWIEFFEGEKQARWPALSVNWYVTGSLVCEAINKVFSIDLVEKPFSGGRILPMTEALKERNKRDRQRVFEYNYMGVR